MKPFDNYETHEVFHPIDMAEGIAAQKEWNFKRSDGNQITLAIEGQWRSYTITLAWSAQDEALQLICTFDLTPPDQQAHKIYELLNEINATCWAGSFCWVQDAQTALYRYSLMLSGGQNAVEEQIDTMVQAAIKSCETYYPAFQLVTWGERNAQDALKITTLDPLGHA